MFDFNPGKLSWMRESFVCGGWETFELCSEDFCDRFSRGDIFDLDYGSTADSYCSTLALTMILTRRRFIHGIMGRAKANMEIKFVDISKWMSIGQSVVEYSSVIKVLTCGWDWNVVKGKTTTLNHDLDLKLDFFISEIFFSIDSRADKKMFYRMMDEKTIVNFQNNRWERSKSSERSKL